MNEMQPPPCCAFSRGHHSPSTQTCGWRHGYQHPYAYCLWAQQSRERDRWSEANSRWQQLLSYCKCNNIKHPEYMDDSHEHCLFITTQTVLVFRGKSSKYIMTSENKYKEQKTTSSWWFLMTTDFSRRIGHFLLGRDTNNYLVLRQKQAEDTCVYSELFIYLRYKKNV